MRDGLGERGADSALGRRGEKRGVRLSFRAAESGGDGGRRLVVETSGRGVSLVAYAHVEQGEMAEVKGVCNSGRYSPGVAQEPKGVT